MPARAADMTVRAMNRPAVRATDRAPTASRRGRMTPMAHRLLAAGTAVYPPGAVFGPRRLAEFELVWLDSGSASWRRERQQVQLHPGDVLLVPPGAPDTFNWDQNRPTAHGYAHVVVDAQVAARIPGDRPVLVPAGTDHVLLAACAGVVDLLGSDHPAAGPRLAVLLATAVDLLVIGPTEQAPAQWLPPPLVRAVQYAGARWARSGPVGLPLAELAAAAGVSPRTLSRLAAPVLPDGLIRSLERIRLARFAVLLVRSTLTVQAAGRACGYPDPFHLSRHFRSVYGITPRGYRTLAARGGPLPDPMTGTSWRQVAGLLHGGESTGGGDPTST